MGKIDKKGTGAEHGLLLLYRLIHILALPFIFFRLYRRGAKNPGYRQHWGERLGHCPFTLKQCIWLHAVSLGESIAAKPLIEKLLEHYPHLPLVVTNTTPTGRDFIEKNFKDRVYNAYLPYDLPLFLRRFIKRVHPKLLIVMETEIWPHMLLTCQKHNIPSLLANARLSERSYQGYAKLGKVIRKVLPTFSAICAQYADDRKRFIQLGYPENKIEATGSIKFDMTLPNDLEQKAQTLAARWEEGRPVWIAASTHEGEEEQILQAHQQVLRHNPNCLLILVPRHPERFQSVATLCQQQGFTTQLKSTEQPCTAETQVLVGDTMGELLTYYAASDIAFVGGSLKKVGGHNLLEPAALGLPCLTGPHYFNFQHITESLIHEGAAQAVDTADQLADSLLTLLADKKKAQTMGQKAKQWFEANQGATERHLKTLKPMLSLEIF